MACFFKESQLMLKLTTPMAKRIYERCEHVHSWQQEPWVDYAMTPEYQAFVNECVKYCHCSHDQPCDGVLVGGICDNLQWTNDHQDNEP